MTIIFCNIPKLSSSIKFTFEDIESSDLLINAVNGKLAGIRLPEYEFATINTFPINCNFFVECRYEGSRITAKFRGDADTDFFQSSVYGIQWDFWKIVMSCLMQKLSEKNITAFHGACLLKNDTCYLILGHSGAGKSSVSYIARYYGAAVFASELCFLSNNKLIAGNSKMSISPEAIEILGIPLKGDEIINEGRLLCNTASLTNDISIDKIIFPKITSSGYAHRLLMPRHARMLLYENAFSQLGIGQLINQQKDPLLIMPGKEYIKNIAEHSSSLSQIPTVIMEGELNNIWNNL